MSAVIGAVRGWLRAEGLAVLAAATLMYCEIGASWLLFAALFLVPDLSMLGYLGGASVGARAYNVAHSYLLPLTLAIMGVITKSHVAVACALIWIAHIGVDRLLGYGLKYPTAFGETHLGRIGRQKAATSL